MENEEELKGRVISVLNVCFANNPCETKAEFAETLGTNYLQLYRWMNGKTVPRKKSLQKICETCGIDYYTVIDIDNSIEHPYREVNIGSVGSSYKKLLDRKDTLEDRKFLVGLCGLLVSREFLRLKLNNEVEIWDAENEVTPSVSIRFTSPDLLDLHTLVFGTLDTIMIKCFSDINSHKIITEAPVSVKEVCSFASYLNQNHRGKKNG